MKYNMVNLGVPDWEFRVVPKVAVKEINPFDIILRFDNSGNLVYLDEDLQQTINHIVETHGSVYIKVSWFSPDVLVITPEEKIPLDNSEQA